jgi:hypothetical protein
MVLLWTMGMMKVSVPQVMDSWLRTSCCGVKANRGQWRVQASQADGVPSRIG